MRYLLVLVTFLVAVNVWAAPGSPTFWDRSRYGDKPGMTYVVVEGYNSGITTTNEVVWPQSAAYTPLTAAMSSPYCASADATDDGNPVNNGARTIRVSGVNTSFAAFTEDLTMDGQTSVTLATTNVLLINSVEVLTAGSTGANAGIIRCGTGTNTAGVPATVHAHVAVGLNRSMQGMYGVPAGYTMICKNWQLQSYETTAARTVQFQISRFINLGIAKTEYLGFIGQAASNTVVIPNPVKFAEKTIWKLDALSGTTTGPVSVRADCVLIKNTWVSSAQDLF